MMYVGLWARAFALTLLVELGVALALLPRAEPRFRRVAAVAVGNIASHPAVWFVFPALGFAYAPTLIVSELWAIASETLIYKLVFPALSWRRAAGISALANGASVIAGLLLRELGVRL